MIERVTPYLVLSGVLVLTVAIGLTAGSGPHNAAAAPGSFFVFQHIEYAFEPGPSVSGSTVGLDAAGAPGGGKTLAFPLTPSKCGVTRDGHTGAVYHFDVQLRGPNGTECRLLLLNLGSFSFSPLQFFFPAWKVVSLQIEDAAALTVSLEVACTSNNGTPSNPDVCDYVLANMEPGDYAVSVAANGPSPASFPGSAAGTLVTAGTGAYSITVPIADTAAIQNALEAQSVVTTFTVAAGSDCTAVINGNTVFQSADGSLAAGDSQECNIVATIFVDDGTVPNLTVSLDVACASNDGDPSNQAICDYVLANMEPADYTVSVAANGPSPASFPGSAAGTLVLAGTGAYSITVPIADTSAIQSALTATSVITTFAVSGGSECTAVVNGNTVFQSADGSLDAGDSQQCNIVATVTVNGGTVPNLTVSLTVECESNDGDPDDQAVCDYVEPFLFPADYAVTVTGNAPSPADFSGNASGTLVTGGPGGYSITVALASTAQLQNDLGATSIITTLDATGDCTALLGPNLNFLSADGTLSPGDSQQCDIVATVIVNSGEVPEPSELTVSLTVECDSNDGDPDDQAVCDYVEPFLFPADYAVTVSGNAPSPANFPGSALGTLVAAGPGAYLITVAPANTAQLQDDLGATSIITTLNATGDCTALLGPNLNFLSADGTLSPGDSQQCDIVATVIVNGGEVP